VTAGLDALTMVYEERTGDRQLVRLVRDAPGPADACRPRGRRRLRLDPMIGRIRSLDEINEALALFERGEEARTVIAHG
jgi:hypothetical protein